MTVSRKVSLNVARSDLCLSFPKISGRIKKGVNSEKDFFVYISISSHLSFFHKVHNLVIQGNYFLFKRFIRSTVHVYTETRFYLFYSTCLYLFCRMLSIYLKTS